MIQKFWNPVKQWCSEHAYYWFSPNRQPCQDMISFFLMIVTSWLFDLPGQRPHGSGSTTRRRARHHLKVGVNINKVFSINKLIENQHDLFESAPRHQWSTRTCCRELSSAWTARNLAPEQAQWSRWNILEYSEQAQRSRWNIPINVNILEGTDPSSIACVEDRPWHFPFNFVISPQHLPGGCRCPRSGQLHFDNWWITKDVKNMCLRERGQVLLCQFCP